LAATSDAGQAAALEKQLEAMGGTAAYQAASVISTRNFKTSRWVLGQIAKHCPHHAGRQKIDKLRVLEVGAINTELQKATHLDVRAIDIHSSSPLIEELDFFMLPPVREFDVVINSMVINCLTDPTSRGEMLVRLCLGHLRDEHGLLLLALPTRCITSAHVGGLDSFCRLLRALGQEVLETSATPKISFFSLRPSAAAVAATTKGGHQGAAKTLLQSLPSTERKLLQSKFGSAPTPLSCKTSADFSLNLADAYWNL